MQVAFIGRALRYSPQHIEEDAAILVAVRQQLEMLGYDCLPVIDEDSLTTLPQADVYVSMGRKTETLKYLREAEHNGHLVVNSTEGVTLCNQRARLMRQLEEAGVDVPPLFGKQGYWVKRADGCRESDADIQYASTHEDAQQIAQKMFLRGIREVEIRAHIDGDWVKCYGVRETTFFHSYRMEQQTTAVLDESRLHTMLERSAAVAGLDVYGGDAIICPDGRIVLVDLNDWPSFSRCRQEAAEAIAHCIHQKTKQ